MSTDELYLENLDEFVNDENRVVTYKWLSRALKVHVNEAKQMLFAFCEQQRNKKDNEISITYFVSGSAATAGSRPQEFKCAVVSEEQLASYKASLAVVNCVHIYSIHRCKLKDSSALYIADRAGFTDDIHTTTQHSALCCPWAKVRMREEHEKLGVQGGDVSQGDQGDVKTTKAINGSSAVTKKTAIQKTTKAEPKGIIASMFSGSKKTSTDSSTKTAATQNEKSDTVTKSKKTKESKGSIVSMFASAPKKTGGKPSPTVQTSPTPDVRTDTRQEAVKEKGKPLKIGRTKKKGSPCSDDELKPDSKRRKRIKEDLFDSSSEEEMDVLEESPVPSRIREPSVEPEREPSVEPESPTPETKEDRLQEDATEEKSSTGGTRRRRTRKLVPKTYMDESGFMVTEKVWESDSTDASEVEEITLKQTQKKETTKQPEPEPLKKQAKGRKSPQKKGPASGKTQASLTSFFKKN